MGSSLPEELQVTLFICSGAAGFLFLLYLLGRLLAWRRRDSPLPFLMVLAGVLVMVAGVSLYLDRQPTIAGIVEGKRETIEIDDDGNWSHNLAVTVRYTRPGADQPQSGELTADPAIYDRVTIGDPVDIRFLHLGGWLTFTRLSERSTLSILLGARWGFYSLLTAVGLMALLWLSVTRSRHKMMVIPVFGAMVLFVFLVDYAPQWRAAWPLTGPQATAVAAVHTVTRITEVGGTDESPPETLVQPIDLVQVEFIPAGRRDPIKAADMIDAGSLPLESGGAVTVRYLLDQPRTVRLEGGARTFVWKNTLWSLAMMALLLLFLAITLLLSWFWPGRRRTKIETPARP
jgi:hypothetical protein